MHVPRALAKAPGKFLRKKQGYDDIFLELAYLEADGEIKEGRLKQRLRTIDKRQEEFLGEFSSYALLWLGCSKPREFSALMRETKIELKEEEDSSDLTAKWTDEQRKLRESIMGVWVKQSVKVDPTTALLRRIKQIPLYKRLSLCLRLWGEPWSDDAEANAAAMVDIAHAMCGVEDIERKELAALLEARVDLIFAQNFDEFREITKKLYGVAHNHPKSVRYLVVKPTGVRPHHPMPGPQAPQKPANEDESPPMQH